MSARCGVATAMRGLHYVLHAPQGDTYADLLFTMIERRDARPPVTYTTFQARDLGGDTAEFFKTAVREAYERFKPQAMIVGASCTAELIQDDPGGLARALDLPIPVIPLELPAYQKKENWGAAETFYRLVRALSRPSPRTRARPRRRAAICSARPRSVSAIATTCKEISGLLDRLGVDVARGGADRRDARRHRPTRRGRLQRRALSRDRAQPRRNGWKRTMPSPSREQCRSASARRAISSPRLRGSPASTRPKRSPSRLRGLPWYSRSVDSTYLTGKRVFIFGDATHVFAAARIARK